MPGLIAMVGDSAGHPYPRALDTAHLAIAGLVAAVPAELGPPAYEGDAGGIVAVWAAVGIRLAVWADGSVASVELPAPSREAAGVDVRGINRGAAAELIRRSLSGVSADSPAPGAKSARRSRIGLFRGEVTLAPDFDAPLPDFEEYGG